MKLSLSMLDRPSGTRDEAADLAKDLDMKMAMSSFPLPSVQDVRHPANWILIDTI